MMTKANRRFPFERTRDQISLDRISTHEEQLYPALREYLGVSRLPSEDRARRQQQQQQIHVSHEDDQRLNVLLTQLKQPQNHPLIDTNDVNALRQTNIQHWKSVKQQWQKYYRDQVKRDEIILDNLMEMSRRQAP
jgi:alpha-galactosidase/6-phospho-beta-glucosidase family protein